MTNEKKTYEEVARLCSKYNPVKCCDSKGCKNSTAETNGYKNSTAETSVSCKTCTHFTNSYCDLNLYDEIAKKHNI